MANLIFNILLWLNLHQFFFCNIMPFKSWLVIMIFQKTEHVSLHAQNHNNLDTYRPCQ